MEYKLLMTDCIVKDSCSLFNSETDACPYKSGEAKVCMRQYKINYLLDQALLSDAQKERKPLLLDRNKIDLDAFSELNAVKNDILSFTKNGKNIYNNRFIFAGE